MNWTDFWRWVPAVALGAFGLWPLLDFVVACRQEDRRAEMKRRQRAAEDRCLRRLLERMCDEF